MKRSKISVRQVSCCQVVVCDPSFVVGRIPPSHKIEATSENVVHDDDKNDENDENGNYEGKELTRSTVYPRKVDADGSEDSLEEIGWTLSTNEKEMKIKSTVAGKRPNSSTESGSVEGATKKKKVRFNDPATMGPYVVGQKNDQFVASRTEKVGN